MFPCPFLLFGLGDAEELFEGRLGFGLVVLDVSALRSEVPSEVPDGLSFAFGFEVELVEVSVLEGGVVHFSLVLGVNWSRLGVCGSFGLLVNFARFR